MLTTGVRLRHLAGRSANSPPSSRRSERPPWALVSRWCSTVPPALLDERVARPPRVHDPAPDPLPRRHQRRQRVLAQRRGTGDATAVLAPALPDRRAGGGGPAPRGLERLGGFVGATVTRFSPRAGRSTKPDRRPRGDLAPGRRPPGRADAVRRRRLGDDRHPVAHARAGSWLAVSSRQFPPLPAWPARGTACDRAGPRRARTRRGHGPRTGRAPFGPRSLTRS